MKLYEIADSKTSSMGEYLPALMKMEADENPIFTVLTSNFKGHLLFCYENGKMAKIPLASYETVTNRKKLTGAYYAGAKLVCIHLVGANSVRPQVSTNEALSIEEEGSPNDVGATCSRPQLTPIFQLSGDKMSPLQTEFVAISSNQKVLVFNTASINEKTTRSSQGVSVLTLKKGAKLDKVIPAAESGLTDLAYYRTKNIPAIGCFLKKEDTQQSFI